MTQGCLTALRIPVGWTYQPLGQVCERSSQSGAGDWEPLSVFLGAGVVPRSSREDNHNQLGFDLAKNLRVAPGDLVINKLRAWQGGLGVSGHRGIVSPAYFVLRSSATLYPRYLHFLLQSKPYLSELTRLSKWMPPSQFDLPWDALKTLPVLTPPLDVQRRIADFLDDQISRIDSILRATEQQISLLRSREMGWLDHQMQMLGSEFGRVPLRRWITHIEQGWSPQCDSRPADAQEAGVLKLGSVRGGRFREQEKKAMSQDTVPVPRYAIRPRDLLVSRANTPELVGEAAVVPDDVRSQLYLCDLLYRVRTSIEEVEFISAALRSRKSRGLLGVIARGTSQSMVKLRGEDIGNVSIPAAPTPARRMLAAEAATTMADSDAAVAAIQDMRTLLQERKRALITAAVTGEFDVSTASGRNIA